MTHTTTRTQPTGRLHTALRVRWLPLLAGLLFATATLSAVPASGQQDPPEDEALAQQTQREQELRAQYGDIGCRVVPGFSDRCPSVVSWPTQPTQGVRVVPRKLVASSDGAMLYAVGTEDGGSIETKDSTRITAYRAESGDAMWSREYGRQPLDEAEGSLSDIKTVDAAISPDGKRLYIIGVGSPATAADGAIAEIDTATGEITWALSVKELLLPAPVRTVFNGRLVVTPDSDRILGAIYVNYIDSNIDSTIRDNDTWHFALDAASGATLWKQTGLTTSLTVFRGGLSLVWRCLRMGSGCTRNFDWCYSERGSPRSASTPRMVKWCGSAPI